MYTETRIKLDHLRSNSKSKITCFDSLLCPTKLWTLEHNRISSVFFSSNNFALRFCYCELKDRKQFFPEFFMIIKQFSYTAGEVWGLSFELWGYVWRIKKVSSVWFLYKVDMQLQILVIKFATAYQFCIKKQTKLTFWIHQK